MNKVPSIGLSSTSIYPRPATEVFNYAQLLGYDGVEIMLGYDKGSKCPETLLGLIQKSQTPVLALHAPTLVLTQFAGGISPRKKLTRTVQLASKIGAGTVVVHPPFRWQSSYAETFLTFINELEDTYGVKIAVENMFPWVIRNRVVDVYNPNWDTISRNARNLTIDFSHAALSGEYGLDLIQENLDKVAHVHVCDGSAHSVIKSKKWTQDEHLLPGEGDQNVREALEFLNANNYQGSLVLEVVTIGMGREQRFSALEGSLEFIKNSTLALAR